MPLGHSAGESLAYGGDGNHCLRFRDLQDMTKIDNRTRLAHTRGQEKYTVRFRHECRDFDRPDNFYKVRLYSEWECVSSQTVLEFRDGGACFIESVTLVPPKNPG